ncbi:MAG: clostripain-related cysteine peptidase [Acidimicrobiia bacterium]|nr:clostripain-related cysteine peptidase [Acidimicrobiia bacterium]
MSGPTPPPVEPSAPPPPPAQPPAQPAPAGGSSGRGILLAALAVIVVATVAVIWVTRPSNPVATGVTTGTSATTTTTHSGTTPPSTPPTSPSTTTTTSPPAQDLSAAGTWTVIVYGLGDNNLEDALLGDLREMQDVTADTPNLTFVALVDRAEGYDETKLIGIGKWTSAKLIEIADGSFTEISDLGEQNLGEAATLSDLLVEAAAAAPADHYAVVFWDHGSMTGIGPDESHSDVLEGWELAVGLESGLASAGITLDFIGFDACLMASLEVVSVVYPYAAYMIASEELEPNDGWAYDGFAYLGTDEPTMVGLGESLLQAYFDASAAADPSITLSLLDLRGYEAFSVALGGFTETALDNIDASAAAIGRRRDKAEKFGSDPDPDKDWFMVDLGQLLSRLARTEVPVAGDAEQASNLLEQMVVASVAGEASKGARGLSVHFPPAPDLHYPAWYKAFGDPMWSDFLDAYFAAGRAIPVDRRAAVVDISPDTTFGFDDYGLEISAEIQPSALETVVSALLWSGIPEPDGTVTFYSSDQGLVEGRLAVGFYDLTQLWLSDGIDSAIAFQQLAINEDLTVVTMTVPLAYRAPIDPSVGQFADAVDVTLRVAYNLTTEEFTEEVFASSYGTVGAFNPEPDGLFFPIVPVQAPGGEIEWIVTSDVGLWSGLPSLTYDFVDLPSGTPLYGELIVADYGGNTATVYVTTEIP